MTATPYGIHDGDVIFDDDNGEARIPVRVIHALSHASAMSDQGYAAWAGRRFDRDALLFLRRELDANALPRLETCVFTTPAGDCDSPAIHGCYCPQHAKDTR